MPASFNRQLAALHHSVRRRAEVLSALISRRTPGRESCPEPRKLLFVMLGLIGDFILCTPALAEARRLLPRTEIHVLTTGANAALLGSSGWAGRVHGYDGPAFPRSGAARRELQDLEDRLRLAGFDTAVILLGDDFVPLLCRAGMGRRVGVAGTPCAGLLTDRYPVDARTWGPEQKLGALRCLGLEPRPALPRLDLPADTENSIPQMLREMQAGPEILLLHPFGSTPNRTLAPQKAAALADLLARPGRDVLVIGGPGQAQSAGEIVARCARPDRVHAVAGRFSLLQTSRLMQHAAVTVTTDSGPLHLAGALRRPAVGLFRAIRPEYAQLYPTVMPLFWEAGPACLPGCTWESWYGCAASPCRQLDGIANERIAAAVFDCLARGAL